MTQVTERAVLARVNRKLAHEWEKCVKSTSREISSSNFGTYNTVSTDTGNYAHWSGELESLARQIGVMGENEVIVEA